jgi:general secretion pathway protein F
MESSSRSAITLEQLIALNDEIGALVRAGVPLGPSLRGLGDELPGRLGKASVALAEGVDRGEPLEQILAEQGASYPRVYRAIVEAGLRSGRLASALESVASSSRRLVEIRQIIAIGFVYPLLVFLVAWTLFGFFVLKISPSFARILQDFGAPGQATFAALASWRQWVPIWGPAVPAVTLLTAATWWWLSGRCEMLQARRADFLVGWLPWMSPMLRSVRAATFAEVLSLLVENAVPLDQALDLAAASVGDRRTTRMAERLIAALRRGEPPAGRDAAAASLFPLLDWMITAGYRQGTLPVALRRAATMYHRRAQSQAETARLFFPVLLTIAIGGTTTLAYALLTFGPWVSLMKTLATP